MGAGISLADEPFGQAMRPSVAILSPGFGRGACSGRVDGRGDRPVVGEGIDRMKLAKVSRDELALIIQRRALEIAAGEGNTSNIPIPAVDVFPEPIGTSEVHWALGDRQNIRGLAFVWDAAAELSAQYDVETDDD